MLVMTAPKIDLPDHPITTRADFDELPGVPRNWAWELRSGRLGLTFMPVTFWHSRIVLAILMYWHGLGHEFATEQRVADSGFVRGGEGRNNYVADGVAFKPGYRPTNKSATHEGSVVHVVVEAVSQDSEDRDSIEKLHVYALLGIANYWIVREISRNDELEGHISMYELIGGAYKLTGTRLVSQLTESADDAQ